MKIMGKCRALDMLIDAIAVKDFDKKLIDQESFCVVDVMAKI